MFYADVLGILGITSTMIGEIDTVPEWMVFIVSITWLTARLFKYCYNLIVHVIDTQRRLRRERLNGRSK